MGWNGTEAIEYPFRNPPIISRDKNGMVLPLARESRIFPFLGDFFKPFFK
jgi:hypothetical protein